MSRDDRYDEHEHEDDGHDSYDREDDHDSSSDTDDSYRPGYVDDSGSSDDHGPRSSSDDSYGPDYIDDSHQETHSSDDGYSASRVDYDLSDSADDSLPASGVRLEDHSVDTILGFNNYDSDSSIDGSGLLVGTADNDILTGSRSNDRLYGDSGNDELIGDKGRDRMYGGLGSNVFNAGHSNSKKDRDKLYIERESTSETADIIEAIGKTDKIYVQGAVGSLSVSRVGGGIGIFDDDVLQAVYTGGKLSSSQIEALLFS